MEMRGLLFDMCGVLYDDSAWNRWLLQLLQRMGLHTHYDAFYALWSHEYSEPAGDDQPDYWSALRGFLKSAGLSNPQIDEVKAASYGRWIQSRSHLRLFPGVARTLTLLAQRGVPLGIVARTDHHVEEVRRRVAQLGLTGRFQSVQACGSTDQIAESFRQAWSQLHIEPNRGAYVASHPLARRYAHDHCGRIISFNTDSDSHAHHRLRRFEELTEMAEPQHRRLAG